jgi:hypothetical protein
VPAWTLVEDCDLSDGWRWCNTPVDERDEYPIFLADFAPGPHCREIEAELENQS